jgi:sortase A
MLSHVRRRSVVVMAILLVGAGCAGPGPAPGVAPAPPAPAVTAPETKILTSAPTPAHLDPTLPPPGPALPSPIPIPADSYAPEPVREIGTMEIPSIGLKHRIFQGVTLHNIDLGPSHWTGSALPGHMGNAVFAGHRSTHSEPFRRVHDLVAGDRVIFTVHGTRSTYLVTGHLIVNPADTWIADQTTAYTATLYACHPIGSFAERYVVRLALAS